MTPKARTSKPKPPPQPAHKAQPAGGKHVPSNVPGHQVYDFSGAVGSNVVSRGGKAASDEVLDAPPWTGPAMSGPSC